MKKKKKKKKTGFDLDAALAGESGVMTETPPADDERKDEQQTAPVSEKTDGNACISTTWKKRASLFVSARSRTRQVRRVPVKAEYLVL